MYRILKVGPLRFIAESLYNSKPTEHGRRIVIRKLRHVCTVPSLIGGGGFVGLRDELAKSMQLQIIDALRLGERSRASDLLSVYVCGNHSLKADDFVSILNYCTKSPDPMFVIETWRVMSEKGIDFNSMSLLLMIRSLCKGGYLEEASHLINILGDKDSITPVLPLYNCFLGACARPPNMLHADRCLGLMEQRMVGKNEITYTELLKLAVWQQNLSAVQQIWKDYIKHYSISILSLRKFIWSFTRLGDLNSAYETLQHMVALATRGDLFVKTSSEGRLRSSRLDIPVPLNCEIRMHNIDSKEDKHYVPLAVDAHVHKIELYSPFDVQSKGVETFEVDLLKTYKSIPTIKALRWCFSDVIHACAQARNCELAEHLMAQMQKLGLQPSSHTYDGFVRAIVSEKGFSNGMQVLKMMRQQNLKPYNSTLATLSVTCSKALELDLAELFLKQISECPYPYPFNAFLAACDTMDQPERAVQVLAKMKQLKLLPDIRTYELLFSLFGNVNVPYEEGNTLSQVDSAKRIQAIEMDMAKNGVQHNQFSMGNLLKALGAEGMVREMIQYLHRAENLFFRTNAYVGTAMYNIVLYSLVEAGESDMAIDVFQSMKSCGYPLDAATYNIMIDCCSIIGSFRSACLLVSLMIREGFCPEIVTYTALMKILLDEENFDEALRLLDQANSDKIQLDVLSYNTILQKACHKGRIDVIEYIIERMNRVNIQPDPSTCQYVFSAYVGRGFLNTAVEALQVLSLRMLDEEDISNLEENMTELEDNYILAEDPEAESRIIKLFKDSDDHRAAALLNLRWCAILGFPVSWSLDQSSWARRLSLNHANRERTT